MMKTIASDLLQRHIETLVDDAAQWQTLIADDILWELAYAPSIGHPARLSGREEVLRHVTWFRESVDNFRFFNLKVYPFADPEGAVAEVEAEGVIKATGPGAPIARITLSFCVLQVARSCSSANSSIPCERQRRWTLRLLVSNLEDFPILPKACYRLSQGDGGHQERVP